jgi:hypothetical protein
MLGDRAIVVDVLLVVAISLLVCFFSREPALMGAIVAAAFVLRLLAWSRLPAADRDLGLSRELVFFFACTLIGAFNDWNTVVVRGVYEYTVPAELPAFSTIPIWMLAYWGIILRLMSGLSRWRRLGLPPLSDEIFFGPWRRRSPALRLVTIALLVVVTRASIFRHYEHPVLSWLPFALALVVAAVVLRPGARRLAVAFTATLLGTLIESLYVNVAGLHWYGLGWLGGVPLWIALWWALATLLWGELSTRVIAAWRGGSSNLLRAAPEQVRLGDAGVD